MRLSRLTELFLRTATAAAALVFLSFAAEPALAQAKKAGFDKSACLTCHAPIKVFHDEGRHQDVACTACHGGLDRHAANQKIRPTTNMDPAACGTCHKLQYDSQFTMNWAKPARKEKSQATGLSPNPSWEKLMVPHGFTREHNEARSHMFTVLDQFLVDRAFGGRFEPKEGWQYLTKQGNFKVWDVIVDKYPDLQCGQCHVEYACNPGLEADGKPIPMSDRRTNVFPYYDVQGTLDFYTRTNFRDFRHGITGALLIKNQHPDVENYYGSKHQLAGVECHQCHMPKVKDKKTGQLYTSHWQTSPKHYIKETCLTCHDKWSEKQAKYVIESLHNRIQGKTRKAEFWLTRLIDKFEEARNLGVEEAVLNQARDKHSVAHMHWEWWTASNGHAFHNPEATTTSLAKSVTVSQEGIKILDDAMAARRKGAAPVAPEKK
jgi:formate-dependent nitrite reductase cytochrome c552 subunit